MLREIPRLLADAGQLAAVLGCSLLALVLVAALVRAALSVIRARRWPAGSQERRDGVREAVLLVSSVVGLLVIVALLVLAVWWVHASQASPR